MAVRRAGLWALMLLGTPGVALAAPSLRATIDRNDAVVGERLQLTLTLEGSQLDAPELEDPGPFQVHNAGTSRQVQIVNGQIASNVQFNYILVPLEAGTFSVGKARAEVDGVVVESTPFQVRVRPAGEQPKTGGGDRDVFVTAQVSNDKPFVGEQIIYTLRLYRRMGLQISSANAELPDFQGFLVEALGEQRSYRTVLEGREFEVTELRRALFAQAVGPAEIPPTTLSLDVVQQRRRGSGWFFDPFGGMGGQTQNMKARSSAIALTVRALPAAPPSYSGLVGRFEISAQVSKNALAVGESVTLTIAIKGSGNVRQIPEPRIEGLEPFKVYDDKPDSQVDTTGDLLRGSKTFRRALVPRQSGELTIPAVRLVTFDPDAGSYRTAATAPLVLKVSPSDQEEELKLTELMGAGGKVAVRVIADDIRPNVTDLPLLTAGDALPLGTAGLLAGVPPMSFLGLAWWWRRRRREADDASLRRRRVALKEGLRALRELDTQRASADVAMSASRALRGFLGDALGVEGLALTAQEASRLLLAHGVTADSARAAQELLAQLEAVQYGAATLAAADLGDLSQRLRRLFTTLDRQIPRRRAA